MGTAVAVTPANTSPLLFACFLQETRHKLAVAPRLARATVAVTPANESIF